MNPNPQLLSLLAPTALSIAGAITSTRLALHRENINPTTTLWTTLASICLSLAALTHLGPGARWLAVCLVAWVGPAVTVVDVASHRIPNRVTAASGGVGLVFVAGCALAGGGWVHAAVSVGIALTVGAFYLVCGLIGGLGMGDVKLATALALPLAWFGWERVFVAMVLATLVGVGVAAVTVVRYRDWRRRFAFGPGIVAGFYLAALVG